MPASTVYCSCRKNTSYGHPGQRQECAHWRRSIHPKETEYDQGPEHAWARSHACPALVRAPGQCMSGWKQRPRQWQVVPGSVLAFWACCLYTHASREPLPAHTFNVGVQSLQAPTLICFLACKHTAARICALAAEQEHNVHMPVTGTQHTTSLTCLSWQISRDG